jgi:hypothetical protein
VKVTGGLEEGGFVEAHDGGDFADVNDTHISAFAKVVDVGVNNARQFSAAVSLGEVPLQFPQHYQQLTC